MAASIHHLCDIGVSRKVLHGHTVDNFINGLSAALAGAAFQETLCVVSELADISPDDDLQYAFDTFLLVSALVSGKQSGSDPADSGEGGTRLEMIQLQPGQQLC